MNLYSQTSETGTVYQMMAVLSYLSIKTNFKSIYIDTHTSIVRNYIFHGIKLHTHLKITTEQLGKDIHRFLVRF